MIQQINNKTDKNTGQELSFDVIFPLQSWLSSFLSSVAQAVNIEPRAETNNNYKRTKFP